MFICIYRYCHSKNYSVTLAEKDPSPTPKRQGKYRVLTIDGKCECGSDQGFSRGVALSTCNHVDTKKAQPEMSRLQQRILHKLDRRAKDLPIDII